MTLCRDATSFIEKLIEDNQKNLLLNNTEIHQELVSQRTTTDFLKTRIGNLTSMSKIQVERLGMIERQQNRDSAALMNFLEFIRAILLRYEACKVSKSDIV